MPWSNNKTQSGSVLFYIFIAIGLLAALTFAFVSDNRQSLSSQNASKTAQELYAQANLIRSSVIECTLSYPEGGGDLDGSGTIDTTDNPNTPYPVKPTFASNPEGAQADDSVRNLSCTGAPSGRRNIFQGDNNQGRFLPPPPSGYSEWIYQNDASGVRIKITAPQTASDVDALNRIMDKFSTCQADLNYGGCGARCLTVWIQRVSCP